MVQVSTDIKSENSTMINRVRKVTNQQSLFVICGATVIALILFRDTIMHASTKMTSSSASLFLSKCDAIERGVPTFKTRDQLGDILNAEGHTIGVELGVQRGHYSNTILSKWSSVSEYHLVDVWAPQENYVDGANKNQQGQDVNYDMTMRNVQPWKEKIRVCRDFTSECVNNYPDNYFDFLR